MESLPDRLISPDEYKEDLTNPIAVRLKVTQVVISQIRPETTYLNYGLQMLFVRGGGEGRLVELEFHPGVCVP